jgi:DNA (cytosine-5)-methyltransferase 1
MGERRPPVVALENVVGLATSHGGDDLAAAISELNRLGYSVDVLALDARRFVPQSRPRLFLIGAAHPPADEPAPGSELRPDWLQAPFGDSALTTHRAALPAPPPPLTAGLSRLVEKLPAADARWWDAERTAAFLDSLSEVQAARLTQLREARVLSYRTAYRRTRKGVAVWEVRPDDVSGCLRTALGGSSKQALVVAGRGGVRVRWMTPREYARLMGAGEYRLDGLRRNQALFGFGDAVCVPVVGWLAEHYLMPLVTGEMVPRAEFSVAAAGGG